MFFQKQTLEFRNKEELVGLLTDPAFDEKTLEDHFIDQDNGTIEGLTLRNLLHQLETFLNSLQSEKIDLSEHFSVIKEIGISLFQRASILAKENYLSISDRALYWSRIQAIVSIKTICKIKGISESDIEKLIGITEDATRGFYALEEDPAKETFIISGFDPFRLLPEKQGIPTRLNPSGALGLFLNGKVIGHGQQAVRILALIFPVRYTYFDSGKIEAFFSRIMLNNMDEKVRLILTTSLNNRPHYDMERFYCRFRGGYYDNEGSEIIPPGYIGNEVEHRQFYETNIPLQPFFENRFINDVRKIYFDQSYQTFEGATMLHPEEGGIDGFQNDFPLTVIEGRSLRGSGGNYFSNELPYRIAHLRTRLNSSIPTGHFHLAHYPEALEEMLEEAVDLVGKILSNLTALVKV